MSSPIEHPEFLEEARHRDEYVFYQPSRLYKLNQWLSNLGWTKEDGTSRRIPEILGKAYFKKITVHPEAEINERLFTKIAKFPNAWGLDFRETQLRDEHLDVLPAMPNITELRLGQTHITNDGLEKIAEKFPNLKTLSLRSTQVSDDGIEHLKPLKKLKGLVLDGTQCTEKSKDHLEGIKHLKITLHNAKKPDLPEAKPHKATGQSAGTQDKAEPTYADAPPIETDMRTPIDINALGIDTKVAGVVVGKHPDESMTSVDVISSHKQVLGRTQS